MKCTVINTKTKEVLFIKKVSNKGMFPSHELEVPFQKFVYDSMDEIQRVLEKEFKMTSEEFEKAYDIIDVDVHHNEKEQCYEVTIDVYDASIEEPKAGDEDWLNTKAIVYTAELTTKE